MTYGIGQIEKLRYSDVLGTTVSGLYVIHCVLIPVFFATKPVLESTICKHSHGPKFWVLLDYLFLVLSLASVWYAARCTVPTEFRSLLWSVFVIRFLSETFHFSRDKWLMYLGSITLTVTHIYNHRYCKKSKRNVTTENTNR